MSSQKEREEQKEKISKLDDLMSKDYHEELEESMEFLHEFNQLSEFMIGYLRNKYGVLSIDFRNYLWMLDGNIYVEQSEVREKNLKECSNLALDRYNTEIRRDLDRIEILLNTLLKNRQEHLSERYLQNLLAKYPQIIEPNLQFLELEYKLGDTNYRGDLLFLDENSRKLNVELKVIKPSINDFTNQMNNYLENIQEGERLMYIAPSMAPEQEQFCKDNNIKFKIIDLDILLNG